ncbi:sulfatase [Paenibacillus sp. JSM ZJ436]|uniref:Arylsulfatase n=1 Tax=Paenibacillus algicola TaxID=2565926 RepID=A0A4P8XSL6_9BACL|nr:sulfatase-like hydrolase/transferase [Paenibacillus algicola]QCT03649.1 arylsulfatase [Paenibacillus algicola]
MIKPNVVIIMADQLRYDLLGEHTPNINQIASESVVFNRAYCASPICVPARGAFFTGKYPNETGCLINGWEPLERQHGQVQEGIENLYTLMEEVWDSWHTGKQHLHTKDQFDLKPESQTKWESLERRYDQYLKEHGKRKPGGKKFTALIPEMVGGTTTKLRRYSIPTVGCYEEGFDYFYDGFITKCSLEALQNRDRTRPFLLNAMFLAPHPPLEIPDPWYSKFQNVELPYNVGRWSANQSPLQMYNLTGVLGSRYTREDWSEIWPVYTGLVSLLDDCVGTIIAELKRQNLYDNTLILFTSDHGEMLGSHGLWQKMCMYEESVRTPLFIKFPTSYQPGIKSSDALVSSVDVLPTLCEFLGLNTPDDLSGHSLMSIIEGHQADIREEVVIQYDGNGSRGNYQRCIVTKEFKLIVDLFKDELFIELYAAEDEQEQCNLAFNPQYRVILEQMLETLRKHMAETKDLLRIPENAFECFHAKYIMFQNSAITEI